MKKYLIVTSVIFHILIVVSLFWAIPFISKSTDAGTKWASASDNSEIGVVKDVAILSRDGVNHIGYEIELDGQLLYLSGPSEKKYRVGDKVDLFISEHPYGPLDSLMISILGVHRGLED